MKMIVTYLVLLTFLTCSSIALLHYSDNFDGIFEVLAEAVGFMGVIASAISALTGLLLAFSWFAASYQAQIINREYGTQYTQEEVFYASSVIDTVRMLDRKRIEVNGNLLHPQAD